jgi:poly(3-hydroxybutyrate) depolymerase
MLRRSNTWFAALALVASVSVLSLGLVQPVSGAASALSVSLRGPDTVPGAGGSVTFRIVVHGARSCKYSSSPVVARFNGVGRCTGAFTRTGTLSPNAGAKRYFALYVKALSGPKSKTAVWVIAQQGATKPTTTTTRPTTTTTRPTTTTTGVPGSLQFAFIPGTDVNATVGSPVFWSLCKPEPATGGSAAALILLPTQRGEEVGPTRSH